MTLRLKMLTYPAIAALAGVVLAVTSGMAASPLEGLQGAISIKSQEAAPHVPIVAATSAVGWANEPIRIDGDLSDWTKSGIIPLVFADSDHASWSRGTYAGKDDLSVSLRLCRDDRNMYLAAEISDDRLPAPDRIEIAFADAASPLITTWRDVGMRYGADDVHAVFAPGKDGAVDMHWAHIQQRMDAEMIAHSFGNEAERRVFIEQGLAGISSGARIFSRTSRRMEGAKSVTRFEAAFPWKSLVPYEPVSYAPLKFNIAVHDRDDDANGLSIGDVGWMPGLVGTYSAAHFATLTFDPQTHRQGVEAFAQVPSSSYLNREIPATFSFYNHGPESRGTLELLAHPGTDVPLASSQVTLPPGHSRQTLAVHSEKLGSGKCSLRGRLRLDGRPTMEIPVHAPTIDDTVTVRRLADIEAKITALERNVVSLSDLYQRVKAAGLDTAYPLAYLTLQEMFVPRCRLDLKSGDSDRVLRNTAYLETLYAYSKTYMEQILTKPASQLKVPPRFAPDHLKMRNGYYTIDGRPVFLWGPCTFWYLRQDQPFVARLGFNSVCPELPLDSSNKETVGHMDAWYREGVSVNASLTVPELQAVGTTSFLKEHPEMANLDQNNFMPFLVQHPAVRQAITDGYRKSIDFYRDFPGVRSYWLWNEPWYLNYSERTRRDFIDQYLEPRYKTVEALNERWRSTYKSFDEVELVQWPDPANYAPWYDFQQFRDELLADFFAFLGKTAKDVDPRRPTHTKFMAASLHAFDIETFQSYYDVAGHDGSMGDRDIVFLDFCKSIYPDHPLVNTEVHIHYGGRKAVEMVAWRLALHGLADGNWWCWHSNPRFSDSLGNVESMHALAISGLDLQRLFYPHIYSLNAKPTPVATLFPDVVERRSDVKMVRIRHELAPAQYALGLRPFYATETRIAQGELRKHKIVLAGESDYVKDSTYKGVLEYAKSGGTVILTRGGFAHNEYGDLRDTGELIRPDGGEPYGDGARVHRLGKGRAICIDSIDNQADVVLDGGQCLRDNALPENLDRRRVYQRVLERAMADSGIVDAVRLVADDPSGEHPDALDGIDWRCAKVGGGYTLAVLPYNTKPPFAVKLATVRPVRRIVNLITGEDVVPKSFTLHDGPNLFRLEPAE